MRKLAPSSQFRTFYMKVNKSSSICVNQSRPCRGCWRTQITAICMALDQAGCATFLGMTRLRYRREKIPRISETRKIPPQRLCHPSGSKSRSAFAVLRVNPKRNLAKPCVYVGMSGLPPSIGARTTSTGTRRLGGEEIRRSVDTGVIRASEPIRTTRPSRWNWSWPRISE